MMAGMSMDIRLILCEIIDEKRCTAHVRRVLTIVEVVVLKLVSFNIFEIGTSWNVRLAIASLNLSSLEKIYA